MPNGLTCSLMLTVLIKCKTWITPSCSKWKKKKYKILSVSLEKDSNILPEKFLITNRDTCCMPNRCLQLQVPWSFVLPLCTRAVMKNRQALPLQQPQKTSTHYTWEISLLIRREERSEGRGKKDKKKKAMPVQEKGHVKARVLSRENSLGPPFLTDYPNYNEAFKGVTCFTCFVSMVRVEFSLLYIRNV